MGLIIFLVLCLTCGVPPSWGKTAGVDSLVWVGFEILLHSYSSGLSQRRAEWLVRWTSQVAAAKTIRMASFEEGLGRIMFVAGALEHERPLAVRRIPPYVVCILRYLSGQIRKETHYSCSTFCVTDGCFTRADAQASRGPGLEGGSQPEETDRLPMGVRKERQAGLVISTLEALAVVIALKLRYGQARENGRTKVMWVPSITNNRGNEASLDKLKSTEFPSSAVLMEPS